MTRRFRPGIDYNVGECGYERPAAAVKPVPLQGRSELSVCCPNNIAHTLADHRSLSELPSIIAPPQPRLRSKVPELLLSLALHRTMPAHVWRWFLYESRLFARFT